jgi:hypothetical protein
LLNNSRVIARERPEKGAEVSITFRGMDIMRPDLTTQEELDEYLGYRDQASGKPVPSHAMWAELRPDVLKRFLGFVYQIHDSETFSSPLPYMNVYAVGGFVEGVRDMMGLCEPGTFLTGPGYRRDTVVETLALSFYLAPTWGTVLIADTVRERLASYREPPPDAPSPFPEGWAAEPEALRAGLDYSTPELTPADLGALREWYLRVCGEVPRSIELYAEHRPNLLKAERNRWENIVRTGLPNQMLAFLLIHYEIWRGNAAGTRDALLLARGLRLSKAHAVDALWYGGCFFGGAASIGAVADSVAGVLESW